MWLPLFLYSRVSGIRMVDLEINYLGGTTECKAHSMCTNERVCDHPFTGGPWPIEEPLERSQDGFPEFQFEEVHVEASPIFKPPGTNSLAVIANRALLCPGMAGPDCQIGSKTQGILMRLKTDVYAAIDLSNCSIGMAIYIDLDNCMYTVFKTSIEIYAYTYWSINNRHQLNIVSD
ncbi:hypothetical protein VNO77_27093 [Canavalia gladiata]|uniref:Uncharacterized protein n=1 Tax=Canavalia gladiata TaxID=3824 RepID=A0AAN9QA73_CANGL